jgi:hypothetical protein
MWEIMCFTCEVSHVNLEHFFNLEHVIFHMSTLVKLCVSHVKFHMWNFTCEFGTCDFSHVNTCEIMCLHVKLHMWNFTCEVSHLNLEHVKHNFTCEISHVEFHTCEIMWNFCKGWDNCKCWEKCLVLKVFEQISQPNLAIKNARYYLWRVKRMTVFAVMQVDQNCIKDVQWYPYILTNKKKKTVG